MKRRKNMFLIIDCFISISILTAITLALESIMIVAGDIRCHCNLPICVRTGYMCKSKGPQAGCFVEHSGYGNMDRSSDISKHGCLELLPSNDRHICLEFARASAFNAHQQRSSSVSAASSLANQNPRLASSFKTHNKTILCCLDDMCNYVKTIFDDNTSGGSQAESTSIDQQQSIQRYPTAIIHNNHHRKHNHQQHHPHHHQNNPNLYERSNGIQQHPFPYRTSANEFQLLGRHLQESYDRNDSLSREGSIEFIILFILGLFVLLILLIFCVIRYIKNDVNSNQQKLLMEKYNFQNSTNQRNKFESCYQIEQLDKINMKPSSLANKKSMLGWRHFMSNRHNLAFQKQASSFTKTDSERHRHQSLNKSKMAKKSMKNEQHSTNETCHPLLLSVKVDLNGYQLDPSTKMKILDSDDSDSLFNMKMKRIDTVVNGGAENLPNIISVHNPSNSDNFTQAFRCDYNDLDHPNSMKKNDLLEATDKETTFGVAPGSISSSRTMMMEKRNSIYMSPPSMMINRSMIGNDENRKYSIASKSFDLIHNTDSL